MDWTDVKLPELRFFRNVVCYPPDQVTASVPYSHTFVLFRNGVVRSHFLVGQNNCPLYQWYQLLDEVRIIGEAYFGKSWGLPPADAGTSARSVLFALRLGQNAHLRNKEITDFLLVNYRDGDVISCGELMFAAFVDHPDSRMPAQTFNVRGKAVPFFLDKRVYTWGLALRS